MNLIVLNLSVIKEKDGAPYPNGLKDKGAKLKTDPGPPPVVQERTKVEVFEMTKKLYGWEIPTVDDKVKVLAKSALPLPVDVIEEDGPI